MNQFSQFDVSDPFSQPPPPPPVSQSLTSVSNALSLPPLATYPSKEALFEAIQSWSKPRGYAFTVSRSKRIHDRRQKVYYTCDRSYLHTDTQTEHIRETQTRGLGCPFQVVALETPLGWEVKYRPEARFNTYNHPPSPSLATYPSYCRLPAKAQNTARNLFSAGKSKGLIRVIN